MTNSITIRIAQQDDLQQIVNIHNQAIVQGYANAYLQPFKAEDRLQWLLNFTEEYPLYVAEQDGVVMAWLSIGPYRGGRMALRYTKEISYYVHSEHKRKGLATMLLNFANAKAAELSVKTYIAIVIDKNIASVRLLEKAGYELWGALAAVADFNGEECGHLYYGLRVS